MKREKYKKSTEKFKDVGYDWIQTEKRLPDSYWQSKNEVPLGYIWILNTIKALGPSGESFLNTVQRNLEGNIENYDELPLVKFFLRFIHPIDYKHPHFNNCDDSYWGILFQFIFVACDDVKLLPGEGLPELEFYHWGKRRLVSDLSVKELKHLTFDLSIDMFATIGTDIHVRLMKHRINVLYVKEIGDSNNLSLGDLSTLYNCTQDESLEDTKFIEELYSYLCGYYSQIQNLENYTIANINPTR